MFIDSHRQNNKNEWSFFRDARYCSVYGEIRLASVKAHLTEYLSGHLLAIFQSIYWSVCCGNCRECLTKHLLVHLLVTC